MTSAELLSLDDRCRRLAYWSQTWEKWALHPSEVLRRAIDESLTAETEDVGVFAGDTVMTYFSNRGIETKQSDLYNLAVHIASMADLITTVLRGSQSPLGRPEDFPLGNHLWKSGSFLEASGTRLRGYVVIDRISPERIESLKHSWKALETAIYEMPMTLTAIVVGQNREGRYHGPFSRGYLHAIGKNNLRFQKLDGGALRGEGWKRVFREDADHLSRDFWIERMEDDGVLKDSLVEIDIPVPHPQVVSKVQGLALRKLERIKNSERPEVQPSQCDWPIPCPYKQVCWQFRREPDERSGFIKIE